MTLIDLIQIVARRFGTDDLLKYVDANGDRNRLPAPPIVDMVIRTVSDVYDQHDEVADEAGLVHAVVGQLAKIVDELKCCTGRLWRDAEQMESGVASEELSPPSAVSVKELTSSDMKDLYLFVLKGFDVLIREYGLQLIHLSVGGDRFHEEVQAVGNVVAFFEERRQQLRRMLVPTNSYGLRGVPMTSIGADRADAAVALYAGQLANLVDTPEYWSLRQHPEDLREHMVYLLIDMHHLADAAEMPWSVLIADATGGYEEELEADRELEADDE